MRPKQKKATQLELGLKGFKKKSFPPAKVMRRALRIKADATHKKEIDQMHLLLHRAGLESKTTAGKVRARIKELKEDVTFHQNQESSNRTAGDTAEASEHRVIAKEKSDLAEGLQKLINSQKK